MLKEFKTFLIKQNAIALAIAVVIGVALNTVVASIVEGIIMPPIGLLLAKTGGSWQEWKIPLQALDPANPDAVRPALLIGRLLGSLINFAIVGFVVWRMSKLFIRPEPVVAGPATKSCPHCFKADLDARATRCPHCTGAV